MDEFKKILHKNFELYEAKARLKGSETFE